MNSRFDQLVEACQTTYSTSPKQSSNNVNHGSHPCGDNSHNHGYELSESSFFGMQVSILFLIMYLKLRELSNSKAKYSKIYMRSK